MSENNEKSWSHFSEKQKQILLSDYEVPNSRNCKFVKQQTLKTDHLEAAFVCSWALTHIMTVSQNYFSPALLFFHALEGGGSTESRSELVLTVQHTSVSVCVCACSRTKTSCSVWSRSSWSWRGRRTSWSSVTRPSWDVCHPKMKISNKRNTKCCPL